MTNEELFNWCCKQNCKGDFNCDLCMYEKGRADAIDDAFNSLLLMVKNGYDYPNAEFEKMFIALVEDAIDSVKENLKEHKNGRS